MSFGGVKTYHIIYLDFKERIAEIYEYQKERRYTANQRWRVIESDAEPIETIKMDKNATVCLYHSIIKTHNYDEKKCDYNFRFNGF